MTEISHSPLSEIRIGTSGIVVPGSKSTFPKEFQSKTRLHYYSTFFNTMEINSSFKNTPKASTFQKWSHEVPDHFTFSVKMTNLVTHVKQLQYSEENLRSFMLAIAPITIKNGCLLVQFPASITNEYFQNVALLLNQIQLYNTLNKWKVVIEFRHPGWYNSDTFEMLRKFKTSLVYQDLSHSQTPIDQIHFDIAYLRLHGPSGNYRGNYSTDTLDYYAKKMAQWSHEGKEVYIYFNNTLGEAFNNGQLLKVLIKKYL